ncbi:CHAT domain-containing protein [Pseudomonas sp. SIMBA_067]|uniref:CHAT domain-containing protein n=2 Tax=Bacteria TaxID=2 RepID=UPI00397B92C1
MASINYWLVVPHSDSTTLLQGFSSTIGESRFLKLLMLAAYLPHDTSELFLDHKTFLQQRSCHAGLHVATIGEQVLETLGEIVESGINVVMCLGEVLPKLKEIAFSDDVSLMIISDCCMEGVVNINTLPDVPPCNKLDAALYNSVCMLASRVGGDALSKKVPKLRLPYDNVSPMPFRASGVTIANEVVMASLGFAPERIASLEASNPESYLEAIVETAKYVVDVTNPERKLRQEAVVYVPAIYGPMYNINQHFWNQVLRKVKLAWHRDFIKKGLIRNIWFSNISIENSYGNISEHDSPYNDPAVSIVLTQRQLELLITNFTVANLAAAESLPVIRLPNSVNLNFAKFKEIERIYQSRDERSDLLLQKRFRELNNDLKEHWSGAFGDFLSGEVDSLKICSDIPLEWVYLSNLPLMISHEVSKIPMTPGNLFLQSSMTGGPLYIPEGFLHEVLVIRSFEPNDPIRHFLQVGIELFKVQDKIKVTFVDVRTVQQVIDALNGFDKALVIFDCHGGHDGNNKAGWLKIGKEKLDTWTLAGKARVPPIALLSACSTSAIGGSHASVANGLLRSGARSVVGTFLPVDARDSSVFMARLLYRIHSFLPVLKGLKSNAISWRTFMTGLFRMSFTTDVLKMFRDENSIISEEQYMTLHRQANMDINRLDEEWYGKLLTSASQCSGLPPEELSRLVTEGKPLLETMLYCQVGRPELIVILIDEGEGEYRF